MPRLRAASADPYSRLRSIGSSQQLACIAMTGEVHPDGGLDYAGAESIVHEPVCLDVQIPRHPADPEALELIGEAPRLSVRLTEMRRRDLPLERQAVNLLFALVAPRYERG